LGVICHPDKRWSNPPHLRWIFAFLLSAYFIHNCHSGLNILSNLDSVFYIPKNNTMYNPFLSASGSCLTDEQLIEASIGGDKASLEDLIRRHQGWIYNICIRMVGNTHDAADLTQEILVKVITGLGRFEKRSQFRTWLYRIVKNNVINWEIKKTKIRIRSFRQFGEALDRAPDLEISGNDHLSADKDILIRETKLRCMTGMLLCLDKKQRLVFILGELFDVNDTIGSEIMEISKTNFRALLSRARAQLYNFMQEKCGLENKNNPCRCARKTKAFIEAGIVNPHDLQFAPGHQRTIEETAETRQNQMEHLLNEHYRLLYRQHPFLTGPDLLEEIRKILSSDHTKQLFNFKNR